MIFVAARKEEGSDWIKIVWEDGSTFGAEIPTLDRETIAAVIEAAHAEELLAVIHVSTLEHGLAALAMGVDGLVHVWGDEVLAEDAARPLRRSRSLRGPDALGAGRGRGRLDGAGVA